MASANASVSALEADCAVLAAEALGTTPDVNDPDRGPNACGTSTFALGVRADPPPGPRRRHPRLNRRPGQTRVERDRLRISGRPAGRSRVKPRRRFNLGCEKARRTWRLLASELKIDNHAVDRAGTKQSNSGGCARCSEDGAGLSADVLRSGHINEQRI